MTCEQARSELVECWASVELLSVAVTDHLEGCDGCRREALILRRTYVMVQSLPQEHAPDGFIEGVLARLDREATRPGWQERLSEFFAPAQRPSWARAAAVGTAVALAVAGGVVWYNQAQPPAQQAQMATGPVVSPAAANDPAGIDVGEIEFEELLARHQAHEITQPLADDAGVRNVVYTANR